MQLFSVNRAASDWLTMPAKFPVAGRTSDEGRSRQNAGGKLAKCQTTH